MATPERGLGRGLDSLLRSTREAEAPARDTRKLALTQLVPAENQPRKWFDDAALGELSASIKSQGVVQPLIVRPKAGSVPQVYEIVAGERRWRAARLAGLTEVPVVITAYSDVEAMTVALVENLQRENLNPLEEADALQMLRVTYALSQEELAVKLGKSRPAIANALRLLALPQDMQQALAEGKISAGHARALLSIADDEARSALFARVVERELSVREAEAAADCWKRTGALPHVEGRNKGEGESADAPLPASAGRARGPRNTPGLKEMQKALRQAGHHGANISGTEDKGRIAIPYTSKGELAYVLHLLGVGGQEPDSGQPLSSSAPLEPAQHLDDDTAAEVAAEAAASGLGGMGEPDASADAFAADALSAAAALMDEACDAAPASVSASDAASDAEPDPAFDPAADGELDATLDALLDAIVPPAQASPRPAAQPVQPARQGGQESGHE